MTLYELNILIKRMNWLEEEIHKNLQIPFDERDQSTSVQLEKYQWELGYIGSKIIEVTE